MPHFRVHGASGQHSRGRRPASTLSSTPVPPPSFPRGATVHAYRIAVGSTTHTTTRLVTINAAATADTRATLPRLAGNLPRMIQYYGRGESTPVSGHIATGQQQARRGFSKTTKGHNDRRPPGAVSTRGRRRSRGERTWLSK